MNKDLHVVVLMGGWSSEREVSLTSGKGVAAALRERSPFEVFVGHNAASLYATLSDGRPGNAYTLRLENRDTVAHRLELSLEAPAGFDLVTGVNPIELAPTASRELRVFVAAPHVESASLQPIAFTVADVERPAARLRRSATFIFEGTPK